MGPAFFSADGTPLGEKSSETIPTFVEQDRSRARVSDTFEQHAYLIHIHCYVSFYSSKLLAAHACCHAIQQT